MKMGLPVVFLVAFNRTKETKLLLNTILLNLSADAENY